LNPILLAFPVFFALIALELAVARSRGVRVYRFDDSIADLGCGITQQVASTVFKASLLAIYTLAFDRFAISAWDAASAWTWAFAFVAVDFIYYWWHRASHRVNFMWAGHIVHHQSDDYNLSVALRQAMFTQLTSFPMYLPLALLGIPPLVFFVCVALNTLYQFWIHTRLIGKLGPLELVLNTPSHHRVHHGINPEYIDKNYAGVFITWDRLFGTFVEEKAEVRYGIVEQFRSWNALWANFHYYPEIARKAAMAQTVHEKLWAWFAPPEWLPAGACAPLKAADLSRASYETNPGLGTRIHVGIQFAVATAAVVFFIVQFDSMTDLQRVLLGGWVFVTAHVLGLLLEGRKHRWSFEAARLVMLTGILWLFFASSA